MYLSTHRFAQLGALLAMLAVVLGAFGAHALTEKLTDSQLHSFETGVRYQMYHSLAMLVVALSANQLDKKWSNLSLWFWLVGVLLFSGSLYLLSCHTILFSTKPVFLGPVTPIGGLLLIIGWVCSILSVRNV